MSGFRQIFKFFIFSPLDYFFVDAVPRNFGMAAVSIFTFFVLIPFINIVSDQIVVTKMYPFSVILAKWQRFRAVADTT